MLGVSLNVFVRACMRACVCVCVCDSGSINNYTSQKFILYLYLLSINLLLLNLKTTACTLDTEAFIF